MSLVQIQDAIEAEERRLQARFAVWHEDLVRRFLDAGCTAQMREYAETICAPRLTDATEVPLTPFVSLLAEACR